MTELTLPEHSGLSDSEMSLPEHDSMETPIEKSQVDPKENPLILPDELIGSDDKIRKQVILNNPLVNIEALERRIEGTKSENPDIKARSFDGLQRLSDDGEQEHDFAIDRKDNTKDYAIKDYIKSDLRREIYGNTLESDPFEDGDDDEPASKEETSRYIGSEEVDYQLDTMTDDEYQTRAQKARMDMLNMPTLIKGMHIGVENITSEAANIAGFVASTAEWAGGEDAAPMSRWIQKSLLAEKKHRQTMLESSKPIEGFTENVIAGFAAAPIIIAQYMGGIKAVKELTGKAVSKAGNITQTSLGMGLTGAMTHADEGLESASKAFGKDAVLGAWLGFTSLFGRTTAMLGASSGGAGITYAAGGKDDEIAASAFVMFGLSAMMAGGNVPKTAKEIKTTEPNKYELSPEEAGALVITGKAQPWELTYQQYEAKANSLTKKPSSDKTISGTGTAVTEGLAKMHWDIVQRAIKQGQHVPEEVVTSNPNFRYGWEKNENGLRGQTGEAQPPGDGSPPTGLNEIIQDTNSYVQGGYGSGFARKFFNKPVQNIRNIGSPTAIKLGNMFKPYEFSRTPLEPGYFEKVQKSTGEYATRLNDIIEPLRGRFKLNKRLGEQVISALRTGRVPEHLQNEVISLRRLLNDFQGYAREAGLETGYETNYFPRLWDAKKIERNPNKLIKELMKKEKWDKEEASTFVNRIIEKEGSDTKFIEGDRLIKVESRDSDIAKEWSGRVSTEGAARDANLESPRTKFKNEDTFSEYFVNDIDAVLSKYIEKGVERIELARVVGPGEGKLNNMVRDIINETRGSGIEVNRITSDVYDMIDAIQGKYETITSTWIGSKRAINRFQNTIGAYETLAHMGTVALASFPETLAPALRFGIAPKGLPLKSYVKGMGMVFRNAARSVEKTVTGVNRIDKADSWKFIESLNMATHRAMKSSQQQRFTGFNGKAVDKFMRATMLEQITNVQRYITVDMMKDVITRNVDYLARDINNSKARDYSRELIELGINPLEAIRNRTENGFTPAYQEQLKYSYIRGANETISRPDAGNTPLVMQNPRFKLIYQFQKFFSVFGNTFVKRILKDSGALTAFGRGGDGTTMARKANITASMIGMTAIAYYTQFLREEITGHKPPKGKTWQDRKAQKQKRIPDAIDRTGVLGQFTRGYALLSPYKYGYTDSMKSRIASLLGPTVGDSIRFYDDVINPDTGKTRKDREKRSKRLSKMVPGLNIMEGSRDMTEDAFSTLLRAIGL